MTTSKINEQFPLFGCGSIRFQFLVYLGSHAAASVEAGILDKHFSRRRAQSGGTVPQPARSAQASSQGDKRCVQGEGGIESDWGDL